MTAAEIALGKLVAQRQEKARPQECPALPYVGLEHVEAHTTRLLGTGSAAEMRSTAKRFYTGDVLYSRLRPYLNKVWRADRDGLCSSEFIVLPGNENVDPDFLCYRLNAWDFVAFANSQDAGDRPRVNYAQISSFILHPFSLPTQRRIVSKVDELLSCVDDGTRALARVGKLVERYRQSVLKAAVTGELTRDWRAARKAAGEPPESGQALLERILVARREAWEAAERAKLHAKGKPPANDAWKKKYKPPQPPDTTDLPDLPEGWVWASMDQLLVRIEAGKSFKCEERPPRNDEYGIVKVSAVTWGAYDESESKTIQDESRVRLDYLIRQGDFLFSRANTIELVGASTIVHATNRRLLLSDKILRFVFSISIKDWCDLVLKSRFGRDQIERLSTGNQESMRNIGQQRIAQIAIPIPPVVEITEIVRMRNEVQSSAASIRSLVRGEQHRSAALRQSILKAAFAGQLVPQDPNDEPASALLERIAAERATATPAKARRGRKRAASGAALQSD